METLEKQTLRFFQSPTLKWTLEPEIPAEVPSLPNKRMSPKKIQLNKTTRNLTIMSQMLKCVTQNLAKDGSMTSEYVRPVLDAMNQVVNNISETLTAKITSKRKQETNDKAEDSDSSDEEEGADLADMDINEMSQEMMLGGEQESETIEAAVNECTCVKTL